MSNEYIFFTDQTALTFRICLVSRNKVDLYTVLNSQSFLWTVLSSKIHDMPTFAEKDILVEFCAILLINSGKMCLFEGVYIVKWNNQANCV